MSKREWRLFIEDILESLGLIETYVAGMEFEAFKNDRKTIDAVVRNFEVLGEAAKYLPEEVKLRYADVDWRGIVGLRNHISHEYFGVSLPIVWNIIKNEIPRFKSQIAVIQKETK